MTDDWSAAERATATGRLASEQRQRAALESAWEYRLRWGHEPSTGPEAAWRADRARNVTPTPITPQRPNFGPSGHSGEESPELTDEQQAAIDAAARKYVVEVVPESCLSRCLAAVTAKYHGAPPEDVLARVREAHR